MFSKILLPCLLVLASRHTLHETYILLSRMLTVKVCQVDLIVEPYLPLNWRRVLFFAMLHVSGTGQYNRRVLRVGTFFAALGMHGERSLMEKKIL